MNAQPAPLPNDDPRFTPRTQLFLSATIRFDQVCSEIRLRDLSDTGARIEGEKLPDVGAPVHISRGPLNTGGTIAWRNENGCGVRFDEPLQLDQWAPALAPCEHLPPLPPMQPADAIGPTLPQRLAEELAYVGRLLESLGEDLCADPMLALRHAVKLQNLDVSTQILGHVGALLIAEQPEQAIDGIGMVSLRKRLRLAAF